ncbi:hypothetical protein PISL3812_05600 [Talaromyces islandicus]|uniref:Guanine nucleotide-exchange factor SEC12 n=1 Tax=Talaromyces islandicus TaxID=28573 RepID=A0A0U1LZ18_TALIS|nr:hypothetical protein PISL3812_05600 [Talaromyces islandicus]
MAPSIPSAKITLSCPLFAADFDPRNHGLLLVGGGGGEGRSGVGNKIALLNTSKRYEISEIVNVELSRDEDSVTSLAVAKSADESMVALAGINSSQAEQQKGNNRHLRSFELEYPPRKNEKQVAEPEDEEKKNNKKKTADPERKTKALSQASLFRTNVGKLKPGEKVDTYQRLLRLSPYRDVDSPRIGAIATGLAPSGEIVLFNVTTAPQPTDVIGRIRLSADEEAEDIDIIDAEDGNFLVAYTNGTDVHIFKVSASSRKSDASPDVKLVFSIPRTSSAKPPKFRALRFVAPDTLLLLQNAADRAGSELVLLSLPSSSASKGKIIRRKRLRRAIKIGLGLDVVSLGAGEKNDQQHLIAVAGSDQSIEILTLDYTGATKTYGKLAGYTTLSQVHPFSMTKICFSQYRPPPHPVTASTPPQYVKLVSISLGNTVVVQTFPLSPWPRGGALTPRYVLKIPGNPDFWETAFSCFVAIVVIAISCLFLQAFTEIRGGTPPYLGATEWLPTGLRNRIARPYMFDENNRPLDWAASSASSLSATGSSATDVPQAQVSSILTTNEALGNLFKARKENQQQQQQQDEEQISSHIIIQHDPEQNSLSAQEISHSHLDQNDVSSKHNARKWEDLKPEEQERWKRVLSDAGHWAVDEGEQVLKGIFFGQLGGIVGAAVGG